MNQPPSYVEILRVPNNHLCLKKEGRRKGGKEERRKGGKEERRRRDDEGFIALNVSLQKNKK